MQIRSIDPRRAGQQSRGIGEMPLAARMDVDGRALRRPPARAPSVVQVHVRDQDVGDGGRNHAQGGKGVDKAGQGAGGTAFHEHGSSRSDHREGGDGFWQALEVQIQHMDRRRRVHGPKPAIEAAAEAS